MRALTVEPGRADSARLEDVPDTDPDHDAILVQMIALGICGTDSEIVAGEYGWAPPGQDRLILGHESIGRVEKAPERSGFSTGDLIVGIVRRPDPVPCPYCAVGEWDMCVNGRYTERGIKEIHGFGSDYFRIEPEFAVRVDSSLGVLGVLLEPASVVAKAWDHAEQIGRRSRAWNPQSVLVTGAGPIGLLAALIGVQRGLELHVLDRVTEGPKPELVQELGGTYYAGELPEDLAPDVVMECTGAASVVVDAVSRTAPSGIVCLTGIPSGRHRLRVDVDALNRTMVLENDSVFGSVNANRRHYEMAADVLAKADRDWLARLLSRRVPVERWREAFDRQQDDVKVILEFSS